MVKKNEQYIMFSEKQKGKDGCKYIQNVKYRIRKETSNAFYLAGRKKGTVNMILKSHLNDKFVIGNIIRSEG